MPLDVIEGAQWGEEGNGRITDLLAAEAEITTRSDDGLRNYYENPVNNGLLSWHKDAWITRLRTNLPRSDQLDIRDIELVHELLAWMVSVGPSRSQINPGPSQ